MNRYEKNALRNIIRELESCELDLAQLQHSLNEDVDPDLYDELVSMRNSIHEFSQRMDPRLGRS